MLIAYTSRLIATRNAKLVAGNVWTLPPSSVCRSQAQGPQSSRQAELDNWYYTYMYRVRYLELQAPVTSIGRCRHPAPRT